MESGHIKVDQIRKQYDFKIKGAKVFAACNEITRLSRPLQSRFRRLHLPSYTEEQFLEVSSQSIAQVKNCSCHWKSSMGPDRRYSRRDLNWEVGTKE